jgi:hypothetical protein
VGIQPWNGFEEFVRQRVMDANGMRGETSPDEDCTFRKTVFDVAGDIAATITRSAIRGVPGRAGEADRALPATYRKRRETSLLPGSSLLRLPHRDSDAARASSDRARTSCRCTGCDGSRPSGTSAGRPERAPRRLGGDACIRTRSESD